MAWQGKDCRRARGEGDGKAYVPGRNDIPEGRTVTTGAQGRPPQAPTPYMPPPAWPYHPPQQKPPERGVLGVPPLVVLIIVLIIVAAIVGILIMLADLPSGDFEEVVLDFDEEVIVGDGGHFRLDLVSEMWATYEVVLNVSSADARAFDIYVMDTNQYSAAYGNQSTGAFSAVERFENVTVLATSFELPSNDRSYVLVVDNRDLDLTPGDAIPQGTLTVQLAVSITERF